MERNLRKNNGITLVALVITIIILLILAGVAIVTLTQTGLFENAKQAKNAIENAQKNENKILENYEDNVNEYVTIGSTRDSKIIVQTLWENPDTELKAFEPQTIKLANDNYDYFDVIFKYYNTEPDYYVKRAYKGYIFALQAGSGYSNKVAKRQVNSIDNTTLNFENAYYGSSSKYNGACIPVKIIGYKY